MKRKNYPATLEKRKRWSAPIGIGCEAEGEGLEPPWACARLISSQLPYQLGLALPYTQSSVADSAPEAASVRRAARTRYCDA